MYAFALQVAESGLTLEEIVTDIPHDLTALVVYLLLGLFGGFVWYGSRRSGMESRGAGHDPAGSVPATAADPFHARPEGDATTPRRPGTRI